MKKILIAGCGGFGQEVYSYLVQDIKNGELTDIELVGALDDSENSYNDSGIQLPFMGSISKYTFDSTMYVVLCVGEVKLRRKLTQTLRNNKAQFYSYIHSSCHVANNAEIGDGVIICPQSIVNVNTSIATSVVINVFSSIGHGVSIGEGSVLSPYSAINGDAHVGKFCFLGTRATVYPKVVLSDNCVVDSHSAVKKDALEASIISNRTQYVCVPNRFF